MKKIIYILLFISSWSYAQQVVDICGQTQTFSYWAPYSGGTTTDWTLTGPGVSETYTGNEITLTWSDSGTYVLEAIRSEAGCISPPVTYTITVTECVDLVYWVPNTFTPDGDADNETWGAVFTAGYDPHNFQMIVFNRWGNIIWESHDASARWDGTYDNKQCAEGMYIWLMKFNLQDSADKYRAHGHITIIK